MRLKAPGVDTHFTYQVARVRILETHLMNKHTIERLIETTDLTNFIKTLSESPNWQPLLSNADPLEDFKGIIERGLSSAKKMFYELCPDTNLVGAFLFKYDVNNLKILTKIKIFNLKKPPALNEGGLINNEVLRESFENNRLKEFGLGLERPLLASSNAKDPKEIDDIFDKFMYEIIYKKIIESANSFFEGYMRRFIDLTNMISFLRIQNLGLTQVDFKNAFLENGTLRLNYFSEFFNKELDIFIGSFKTSDYAIFLHEGLDFYQKNNSFIGFERARENFLMRYLKTAKYFPFGVEPIVAYFLAREKELRIAELIYTAKTNILDESFIRERLTETYV